MKLIYPFCCSERLNLVCTKYLHSQNDPKDKMIPKLSVYSETTNFHSFYGVTFLSFMCYQILLFSVPKRYSWLLILQETVTLIALSTRNKV